MGVILDSESESWKVHFFPFLSETLGGEVVLEGLDIQHGPGVTAMAEGTLGEPVAATRSGEHLSVGPRNSWGW